MLFDVSNFYMLNHTYEQFGDGVSSLIKIEGFDEGTEERKVGREMGTGVR